MKTSVELDEGLALAVRNAVPRTREKPPTVLRTAMRAGLPAGTSRFQVPRPEGCFAETDEQVERLPLGKLMCAAREK